MILTAFLIFAGFFYASAALLLFVAAAMAPIGHQDENGFHPVATTGPAAAEPVYDGVLVECRQEPKFELVASGFSTRQETALAGTH